jgi:release factor glutamine methyltransferase
LQNRSADAYIPAEDTFFLAEHITGQKGHTALEIGTGSGYLARILEKNFAVVVSTDVDFGVFRSHRDKSQSVCCDGASALGVKFDLIVCNFPYLPSEEIKDLAVDGGPEGLVIPTRIIESASTCLKPGGKILCLTSSLAGYEKIMQVMDSKGLKTGILAKKKLFFEELFIIEAVNYSLKHELV